MKRPNLIHLSILERKRKGLKSLALLLDPDEIADRQACISMVNMAVENQVTYFMVGGSLITSPKMPMLLETIKKYSNIPSIIFPGNSMHIGGNADGILFLSLISGRNPEFLIGQHVISAPILHKSKLEVLSTGYMLIDAGAQTTVSYISNTNPIPRNKPAIAVSTALAGEMLGMKMIYMDAGSGAKFEIPAEMITAVSNNLSVPLIIGGGLNSREKAKKAIDAGADMIVVGNGVQARASLLVEIADEIQAANRSTAAS